MTAILATDSSLSELSRTEFIYTRKCNHQLEELHDILRVVANFAKAHQEYKTTEMIEELVTKQVTNPLNYYRVRGEKQ